jgi:hypothetical protein
VENTLFPLFLGGFFNKKSMRKKFKFKIENRDFIILEPTVEQYWLSLYDFSEFLNEIF